MPNQTAPLPPIKAASKLSLPVPSKWTIRLLVVWLLIALICSVAISVAEVAGAPHVATMIWRAVGGILLLVLAVDWAVAVNINCAASISIERRAAHTAPVGLASTVELKVTNHSARHIGLQLLDGHPLHCKVDGLPIVTTIPAGRFGVFRYSIEPQVRGDLRFSPAWLRIVSPLRLWLLPARVGAGSVMRVFPNYAAVTRYALLAVDHRLSQIGVLKRRRRGEGMDFHQLREYRDGDPPRSIDWKATSRRVKMISREYQDERDQQVVFLLDCGRRMNARDDEAGLSHFDHSLNAILLMAFVAIRQGDAAGLLTFGADENRYIAPQKSPSTINQFLNALYALQPTLKTPDYYKAAVDLGKRLNKRALIVVVSNVRDEDEDGLAVALAQLRRRHLVLFANLTEASILEMASPISAIGMSERGAHHHSLEQEEKLLAYAGANHYLMHRQATLARLRAGGVNLIDVIPEKLPISLVNRYLDMKQSGVF
jgi:uncharacterized protein (DUF58 family)